MNLNIGYANAIAIREAMRECGSTPTGSWADALEWISADPKHKYLVQKNFLFLMDCPLVPPGTAVASMLTGEIA